YQATLLRSTGEFEAADLAGAEALELFRVLSDPMGIGDELLSRGWALLDQEGDIGAARSDLDENLAIRRQIGDEPGVAIALMAMGRLARREGDLPQAERHGREALAILEGCGWGSSINTAMLIQLLAQLAGEQQRAEEAWSLGGRALRIMLLEHSWETAGTVLEDMADWAMERGEWVRAARLTGATERLIPAGEPSFDGQERPLPRLLRPLEEHLGKEACAREREVGRGLSDSEVLELLEFFAV
ncbi:MAG TPA: tetratricopeptide repeat protein, partial [Armatimonadota bacterium]|nr:tetratricopeptide repeat protein [Armatimonadota bacterium]